MPRCYAKMHQETARALKSSWKPLNSFKKSCKLFLPLTIIWFVTKNASEFAMIIVASHLEKILASFYRAQLMSKEFAMYVAA